MTPTPTPTTRPAEGRQPTAAEYEAAAGRDMWHELNRVKAENARLRQSVVLGLRPQPSLPDPDDGADGSEVYDTSRYGPGACANCRFFRWKSDDEAGMLWGKCDNPKVHESAHASGAGFFRSLCSSKRIPWETINEATDHIELRVSEAFGCRFFEQADWMPVGAADTAQGSQEGRER